MLDAVQTPRPGYAARFGRRLRRENGLTVRRISVLGAPVLHISVESEQNMKPRANRALEKRLREAEQIISGEGAEQICFAYNFPYAEFFLQNGFSEPEFAKLYEIIACQAVKKLPGEGGTAFFTAPRLGSAACETLTALCNSRRYVFADVASGSESFFRDMQKRLGISIIRNPSPRRILDAESAVFMGARREVTELSPMCSVFAVNKDSLSGVRLNRLVTGIDVALPPEKNGELSDVFPKEPFIENALKYMTLSSDTIILRGVSLSEPVF